MKHFLTTGGEFLAKKPGFKLVGRDDDLKRLSAVLLRSKASSVILVGPGGVGATALCMGLQASKDSDAVPYDIVVKRLHWLQPEIFSVPDVKAEFDAVLKILAETSDSILLIEDARDFINNCQSTGNPLFLSALNALIRDNKTQVIFETRDDDLDFVLKASGDMRELYTMIDLEEPMGDDLVAIALNSAQSLEKHHGIKINHDAVLKAIELTNKYRTRDHSLSRAQPERTSNLIDRAYASFRLDSHGHVGPEDQEKIKRYYNNARAAEIQLVALRDELNKIEIAEKSAPPAVETNSGELSAIDTFDRHTREGGMDSPAVSAKKREIINLDEARAENQRLLEEITARVNADLELSVEDILTEFSRLSGISANKLNEDEREKLKNLAALLRTRIYGQDPIIDSVADAIKSARIGRRNKSKPQGSFLFLGPSGVGKTELSKALAWALLDDEATLTRFDMAEYKEAHSIAKLIGAPAGYEGYEQGGILTNAMRKNPIRIILFDEIEKAHSSIYDIFLSILSDGRLTDNHGRTVSFSESIVIMTSNIGQKQLLEGDHEGALAELLATPGVRPEFLNRFAGRQNILFFNALDSASIEKIIKREIVEINAAYSEIGIKTIFEGDDLKNFCKTTDQGGFYDPAVGARGLPGYLQAKLEPIITNSVLDNPNFTGTLHVRYNQTKKSFDTELVPNS